MKYFTIKELCKSKTYPHLVEIPAQGSAEYMNLENLCNGLLDPVREYLGRPVNVSSGYRGTRLNNAVGGSKSSNHKLGYAADLTTGKGGRDNLLIVYAILELGLDFDELIIEKGTVTSPRWIHVAFRKTGNRRKFLYTPDGKTYKRLKATKTLKGWSLTY